jgi:hypothetical protein
LRFEYSFDGAARGWLKARSDVGPFELREGFEFELGASPHFASFLR